MIRLSSVTNLLSFQWQSPVLRVIIILMFKLDVVSRGAPVALMFFCVSCVRVTSGGHARDAAPDRGDPSDGGIDVGDSGDRRALTREVIRIFVENTAATFAETEVRLGALRNELTAWQNDPNNAAAQTAAQTAWRSAMAR